MKFEYTEGDWWRTLGLLALYGVFAVACTVAPTVLMYILIA